MAKNLPKQKVTDITAICIKLLLSCVLREVVVFIREVVVPSASPTVKQPSIKITETAHSSTNPFT